MALVNKPDESIFASSAKQGEVDNFPDLLRGWGITFDQTQGIPPMEWFNFLFKRLDEKHTYLMQRGLPEWSATQDYTKGSCVQFDGVSYRALKKSKNNNPNESNSQYWVRWGFALSEIAQATLTQYGITKLYTGYDSQSENLALTPKTAYQLKQLIDSNTRALGNVIPNSKKSSAVDSNSEDTVANSKAVKTAYDKGVEAKAAAENAHSAANNAQHTANEGVSKANEANNNANGRVSKSGDTMTGLLSVPKIHLTENRTGESLKFGDDAWLGDVDMGNAVGVKGQQHPEQGYIAFGTAKKRFGYDGGTFIADAPTQSHGFTATNNYAAFRIFAQGYDLRYELENGRFKFWNHHAHSNQTIINFLPRRNGELLVDADFTYQKIGDFEIRRYPDGTMIQTFRFNPPGNRVGAQDRKFTFNWAAAFVEKPKIWIQHQNQEKSGYGSLDMTMNTVESETTNTKVTFWVWEWYYNNNLISFDFLAIGRWK